MTEPRPRQHFFAGKVMETGEVVVYVKKLKLVRVFADDMKSTYWRRYVHIAFKGPDGVTRRGRFCQMASDQIDNGQVDGYRHVPVTDPQTWPKFEVPRPASGRFCLMCNARLADEQAGVSLCDRHKDLPS